MKAHLDKSCTLVITPETYEEKFALEHWSGQGGCPEKLLILDVDHDIWTIYRKNDGKKRSSDAD